MSFTPKLVALDVDGTLVDWDNQMTAGVRASVRGAAEAGAHVVISTGRSVPGAGPCAPKSSRAGSARPVLS